MPSERAFKNKKIKTLKKSTCNGDIALLYDKKKPPKL